MRRLQRIVGIAFCLNVILGNVCLLEITFAIEPEIKSDFEAFSRADATECPWTVPQSRAPNLPAGTTDDGRQTPCTNGHCLTTPPPAISCFFDAAKISMPPAIPGDLQTATVIAEPPDRVTVLADITERPPIDAVTGTIVLRC